MPDSDTAPRGDTRDQVIKGHKYDGIQEYDNPMPGWWLWLLWATVIFSVIYILGIHVFDFVDTYEDDLAQGQAELETRRAAFAETQPTFEADEATLATYVGDATRVEAGSANFAATCAPCHGPAGEGGIGPNLTDAYWIHGNANTDIFTVISKGVIEKGMAPWENVFSPEQRAELVAFIQSIQGTNPPNAKAPEGALVE